jgi:hypothetical protein
VGYFAPIAFYSKSLQKHHKRWTSLDVELFAIVASVRYFEHMLLGSKCVIMSDCKAIEFLHRQKELSGRVGRWANYLAQFQFSVSHCRGIENGLSDYLSRNAIPDVRMPDDGELFRDKLLTNQQGVLQFTEKNIPPRWLDNSADEVEAAVQRFKKDHQRHSLEGQVCLQLERVAQRQGSVEEGGRLAIPVGTDWLRSNRQEQRHGGTLQAGAASVVFFSPCFCNCTSST